MLAWGGQVVHIQDHAADTSATGQPLRKGRVEARSVVAAFDFLADVAVDDTEIAGVLRFVAFKYAMPPIDAATPLSSL